MILEEETYKKFGYWPNKLSKGSHKKVIAKCDTCGKIRELRRENYSDFCHKCICTTEEFKTKQMKYKTLEEQILHNQTAIVTSEDLKMCGYRKAGKRNGIQRWVNTDYMKIYIKELALGNNNKIQKYQKQWRENNEIELKKKKREYYEKNEIEINKKHREERMKHPEFFRNQKKDYYNRNKEKILMQNKKRNKRGFIPLFRIDYSENIKINWHHIDKNLPYVIPVPERIHQKIGGSSPKHYRGIIFLFYEWLNENSKIKIERFQSKNNEILFKNVVNVKENYMETFKDYSSLILWLDSIETSQQEGLRK